MKNRINRIPEALGLAAQKGRGGFTFLLGNREESVSYTEAHKQVSHYAAALLRHGITKGDRVCLIIPDNKEFVLTFLAVLHIGAVAVPVAPPISIGRHDVYLGHMRHIISASQSSCIVAAPKLQKILNDLSDGSLRAVVKVDQLKNCNDSAPLAASNDDQPAILQFTSGSTSRPKGVTITYGNLHANLDCIIKQALKLREDDIAVSWLPFFHDMGLVGALLTPLAGGISAVYLSPLSFLKRPLEWLRAISKFRGTISVAPNFAYSLCTRRIEKAAENDLDLSCWRVAGCGAEPIQRNTLSAFAKRFSAIGFNEKSFMPAYGLAESTVAVSVSGRLKSERINFEILTVQHKAEVDDSENGSTVEVVCCGRTFKDHELIIVDQEGKELAERQVGQIVIKGPSITPGYYNNPLATDVVLRDGWLRTGDLGYLADGELYVCGRMKEVIIVAGHNYHPTDIEWCAADIKGVRKNHLIAFGLPSRETASEMVVLAAELKSADINEDDLETLIRAHVLEALGVRIDQVVFVKRGALPKTSSGKLQRAKAKQLYLQGSLGEGKSGQLPLPAEELLHVDSRVDFKWKFLEQKAPAGK